MTVGELIRELELQDRAAQITVSINETANAAVLAAVDYHEPGKVLLDIRTG